MTGGHLNLFGILEFVAENPVLFGRKNGKKWSYSDHVKRLLDRVPSERGGWYLWGRFNDAGWWETVYLGKADKRKVSSLKGRLSDELKEEGICFWASVFGRERTLRQFSKRYRGKYDKGTTRSFRKIGAQFVIWIAADLDTPGSEIERQEKILIRMYRPTHNTIRGSYVDRDSLTDRIEEKIEDEISRIIGRAY
jgi:hypothetical protein